ncbi:6-phosphogluconolactonase [Sinorhizobium psoraleae]|uniref:6-phosphogluconolactonase n=1 Tax=Sinorhizobium psoraleae TaxID=520838 RepID=A0ABT4KRR2_9HYPH|nr:6-phosphogluconolactonase [Sinorhizobium psoraleae]MCZ4094638.1 6-phosphogluconolactonase [Sinorhizobium psoraleae]
MAKPIVFDGPGEMGFHVAKQILAGIFGASHHGRRYLLGCPTGRTPRPVYRAMVQQLRENPIDLSQLVLVMMDEYLTATDDGIWRLAPPERHFSCKRFAERVIVAPINAALPSDFRIKADHIWFPAIDEPEEYDRRIEQAGGIDFFILASGAGDGHVAFNPPGSSVQCRTRVIELAEQTRRDNLQTFPAFGSIDEVPTHGISVGLRTISEARKCSLLLSGSGKKEALKRIAAAGGFTADWPATIVFECSDREILADRAAAGL